MKILITGSSGQLGQALQKALRHHELFAADRRELDIRNLDAARSLLDRFGADWIVNAAAYNFVDRAESEPEAAEAVNSSGAANLARAAAERKAALVHVSTDYVFDGLSARPYVETDEPHPLSVYGWSKLKGEREAAAGNPRHLIVRTAWLFSAAGHNFAKTILGLGLKGDVRVVSDQVGCPTYVPHLAEAIAGLMERGAQGLYHLAGSGQASWYEFARTLFEEMEIPSKVTPIASSDYPQAAKRPKFSVLASARQPEVRLPAWQEGVRAFARELQDRKERFQP